MYIIRDMTLDTTFLEEQRGRLQSHKEQLLTDLRSMSTQDPEDEENFTPSADEHTTEEGENALEVVELEAGSAIESELEEVLRDVDDALQKIEDGDYGICEDCGREIIKDRLVALPHARLCMECRK